jgi:inositol 3-alpha-galactosyltransferase
MIVNGDKEEKSCWVTLITSASYLPGAIILAHSLTKQGSHWPLVVMYTSSLDTDAIATLEAEADTVGSIMPQLVKNLLPRKGQENTGSVAERFVDTWTKLRAFELWREGFSRVVFLDADTAVFRNPDSIFDLRLPDRTWLAANHACVCNLDNDSWAPSSWHKGNCAYTPLTNPEDTALPVTSASRPTYRLLNGGMFLFYPTENLWTRMMEVFNTSDRLKSYQFPDQDFLADFFELKWSPVSWKYNALKTMRYWHPRIWSDDEVVVLHYIVDKPWDRHLSEDGIGGHLGRDGETHRWWWKLYEDWHHQRQGTNSDHVILKIMDQLVARKSAFTKVVPLSQEVGQPSDVQPYP